MLLFAMLVSPLMHFVNSSRFSRWGGTLLFFVVFGKVGLADIGFVFSGSVNATQFGLTASEPLTVTWSYNPSQPPIATAGGPPPLRAFYDNINAVFQVGPYTVTTTSLIAIDHDNPVDGDLLELSAATSLGGTTLLGSINGIPVGEVDLKIGDFDPSPTMFSSLALPSNANYVNSANFIQAEIDNVPNTDHILQQFNSGSFALTETPVVLPTPEPGTLALSSIAILFGALLQLKRQLQRRLSRP